jgi:S-DNA-T family DNA segregation ATPase FtsK/SpoIIIE
MAGAPGQAVRGCCELGIFDHMTDDRRRQLVGVLLLTIGLFLGASLGTHLYFAASGDLGPEIWATDLGIQNRLISNWLFDVLGVVAWLVPVLLVLWGWNRIADSEPLPLALRSVFLVAVSMIALALVYLVAGQRAASVSGLTGAFIAEAGIRHIGKVGTFLAGSGAIVAITLLTTDLDVEGLLTPFVAAGEKIRDWAGALAEARRANSLGAANRPRKRKPKVRRPEREERKGAKPSKRKEAAASAGRSKDAAPPTDRRPAKAPRIVQSKRPARSRRPIRPQPATSDYRHPPLSILHDPPEGAHADVSRDELIRRSKLLEEKLADFGVEASVVQVHPGPVITRFEIEPARGVKVSQIAHLQDDLALAMKATAIRIIAPIPGRGAVGIEIPNEHPAVVYLKDILASDAFQKLETEIPLALGKDTTGRVSCSDLAKMPHLLVAGATGAGKSICLNALLTGMVFRSAPGEVRFLMIDPKRLELPRYAGIPHLLSPVITDAKAAGMALQWLVSEMDRRYDVLSAVTVRDIYGFNRVVDEGEGLDALEPEDRQRLPHIVVVVDEFADLMVRAPREVEAPVQRLAQMARAVGIHLVFATQRPSVDVITGVIKANFASRIAFRVISMTDSRTVLDRNGAETLLGNGDMLFLPTGKPDPIRLHGAYIAPEETARLVAHLRKQGPPAYMFDVEDKSGMARIAATQQDDLYEQAVEVVVGTQMGSTSLLQRRLSVGYARAGRLMDLLEANGIVGPFKGSKARDVLVGPEYLESMGAAGPAVALAQGPEDEEAIEEDQGLGDESEEEWEDDEDEEEGEDDAEEEDEEEEDDEEDEEDDEYEEEDVEIDDDEEDEEEDDDEEDDDRYES